jgi:hypothetical protein
LTIDRRAIEFERADFRLSGTTHFTWRRSLPSLVAKKTVFNYVATYNDFERRFAEFLDNKAADVLRFAALGTTEQGESGTQFRVDYLKPSGAIGFCHPDWVVVQEAGDREVNWIIETKGRVWEGTSAKDDAILEWCERIADATGWDWRYARVNQVVFDKGQFATFDALVAAVDSTTIRAPGIFDAEAIVPAPAATPSGSLLARVTDALDAAGWLAEPVAGSIDPPYLRALDPSETGHVIAVFEGPRRVSRSELEGVAALRASSEDEAWQWVAISESGFSADARSLADECALRLATIEEFLGDLGAA